MREFPHEPYPGLSLVAAALLFLVGFALLGIFGVIAVGLSGAAPEVQLMYGALGLLGVACPFIGIRALFGNHPLALIMLAVLGGLFVIGTVVADQVGAAPLTIFAVFPIALLLLIAAFAVWKLVTATRRAV